MLGFTPTSLVICGDPLFFKNLFFPSTTACMLCTVFTGTSYTSYKKRHRQNIYMKGKVHEIACEGEERKNTEMLRPKNTGANVASTKLRKTYKHFGSQMPMNGLLSEVTLRSYFQNFLL